MDLKAIKSTQNHKKFYYIPLHKFCIEFYHQQYQNKLVETNENTIHLIQTRKCFTSQRQYAKYPDYLLEIKKNFSDPFTSGSLVIKLWSGAFQLPTFFSKFYSFSSSKAVKMGRYIVLLCAVIVNLSFLKVSVKVMVIVYYDIIGKLAAA